MPFAARFVEQTDAVAEGDERHGDPRSSWFEYRKEAARIPGDLSILHDRFERRLLRLRNDPNVRPRCSPSVRIRLLRVIVGDGGRDDDILPGLPVGRRGDPVRRGELQRIERRAAPRRSCGRSSSEVDEDQLDPLVGPDDEDVADRLVVRRGPAFGCPRPTTPAACSEALEIFRSVSAING